MYLLYTIKNKCAKKNQHRVFTVNLFGFLQESLNEKSSKNYCFSVKTTFIVKGTFKNLLWNG